MKRPYLALNHRFYNNNQQYSQNTVSHIHVFTLNAMYPAIHKTFLLFSLVFSFLFASIQTCFGVEKVNLISDFGPFIPNLTDSATLKTNSNTLNSAIANVGILGGGTIVLPEGTFYLGTDLTLKNRAISIGFDNITITGAGMDKTILRTNGTWNSSLKKRGHGIVIDGTKTGKPLTNITLKNFQLDGQSGWTGKYKWPAAPLTGDGWDITHKGIAMINTQVNNVTLENVYVHRYKGEILYTGGMRVGNVTVRGCKLADTNGSCFNLYGANLLIENTEFSGPTRFWVELTARANQGGYPTNKTVFRNNTFKNAVGNIGFAIGSCGDGTSHEVVVESNTFEDAPNGVFLWGGGAVGPYLIKNNTFKNIGGTFTESRGALLDIEYGGGIEPGVRNFNKNITFSNNKIEKCSGPLVTFSGSWASGVYSSPGYEEIENVFIENNYFEWNGTETNKERAIIEYGSTNSWVDNAKVSYLLKNVNITNNHFINGLNPTQVGIVNTGTRPKFAGNSYSNVTFTAGNGVCNITPNSPKITPTFDKVQVSADNDLITAAMETAQYSDGSEVEITGGSKQTRIKFALNALTYMVTNERILTGSDTLVLKFNSATQKWVETDFRTAINTSVKKCLFKKLFSVYPNPTKGELTVFALQNNEVVNIAIYNLSGVKVLSNLSSQKSTKVNLSGFAAGIYCLKIKSKNEEVLMQQMISLQS